MCLVNYILYKLMLKITKNHQNSVIRGVNTISNRVELMYNVYILLNPAV